MSDHLTREQIERYASRTAGVDEILAAAQHLDECFDCRDRAVALVDPGDQARPHRQWSESHAAPDARQPIDPWIIVISVAAVVLFLAIAFLLLRR